jgi:O-antigen ligase
MLLLVPVRAALKRRTPARIPLPVATFAIGYLMGIGFFALEVSGIVNTSASHQTDGFLTSGFSAKRFSRNRGTK